MKIVLFSLNTSWVHTNLAIRCIREALEKNGFEATLFECTEKDARNEVLYSLAAENADIYGFSCYIWNIRATLEIAANIKNIRPSAKIVLGGPEVSYYSTEFFDQYPFVDRLIRGEGEDCFVRLCRSFGNERIMGGAPYYDFENTGIMYRPDEKLASEIVYYESSRGCPYNCAYCLSSLHEYPRVRAKTAEKTLTDLAEFEKLDGIRIIKLIDRTFNFDRERAKTIWHALLDDKYTKKYHFEVCASLIDAPTVKLLSKFPKDKIQLEIGVQSTNPKTLAAINRKEKPEKVCSTVKKLHDLGNMHIHADLIAGLPYEDITSFAKSFDDLWGKCDMLQLGFLKLLHGAPLEADAEKYNYKFTKEPPYEVLENDFVSYDDIIRLKRIEAALERYGNSGRFTRSVAYLTESGSPFAFFDGLSGFVGNIAKLSQRNAYSLLAAYADSIGKSDGKFISALAFDFLLNETGSLPDGVTLEKATIPDGVKHNIIVANPEIFVPALEGYIFEFDPDSIYFIDRKNRKYYTAKRD